MDAIADSRSTPHAAPSTASTNEWAIELSTAALDGDEASTRLALARLLERPVRRSDELFQQQFTVLERVFLKLRLMALMDSLTALCNRRGFMRAGSRLLKALRRGRHGALVFYFNVDNLKVADDSGGHATSDALLLRTAKVLRRVFHKRDILSRLDGDEFAVLAATSDSTGGIATMTRLREAIEANNASYAPPQLSLSVGIARFDPAQPLSLGDLLLLADLAMYGDKLTKPFNTDNQLTTQWVLEHLRKRKQTSPRFASG
jgi:diguanylate cyclase (GGDEF)-like protein